MKNKIKPNVIVWNSIAILILIITAIINLEFAACIITILSLLSFAVFFESLDIYDNGPFIHYWVVITPTFWLLTMVLGIIFLGSLIKEKVFDVISDKIDEKFSK